MRDGGEAAADHAVAEFGPGLAPGTGGAWFRPVRDGEDRLVVVHEGRHSRLWLAELASSAGTAVRFVLKLPRDLPSPGAGRGRMAQNARDEAAQWLRERERHHRVQSPAVLATVPVPEAVLDVGPLAYCRRRQVYFPLGCVVTGARLEVCADETRLHRAGLLDQAAAALRFLVPVDADAAVFYRAALDPAARPPVACEVLDGAAWLQRLPALCAAPAAPAAQRAAAWLPCLTCPERNTCHAPDAAGHRPLEQAVEVVSFYGGRALALDLAEHDFDGLCARLGGAAPESGAATAAPPWLTAGDRRRWPAEVLWTKVRALQQLLRGVLAVHEATGGAHFGLVPNNVLVQIDTASGAPWPWAVQVRLADLGCGVVHAANGLAPQRTGPGPEWSQDLHCRAYAPPWLDEFDGPTATLPIAVRELVDAAGSAQLAVDFDAAAGLRRYRAGDLVSIAVAAPERELWFQLTEVRARGGTAVGPLPSAAARAALTAAKSAACAFHCTGEVPVDCFALGMLLLRALVVDETVAIEDVREHIDQKLPRWRERARAEGAAGRGGYGSELRQRFPVGSWLHHAVDRADPAVREALGAPLLHRVHTGLLELAGELLVAGDLRGTAAELQALLQRVAAGLSQHAAVLQVEVCRREARDQRLHTLLGEPWPEVPAPAASAGVSAATGACLEIQKDGSSEWQRFELGAGPVTIGRHPTENVLCLADPIVSAKHAVLEAQAEGHTVADRGSRNGTEVDGVRLPVDVAFPLADGMVVRIAPFRLRYRSGGVPAGLPSTGLSAAPADLLAALQAALAPQLEAAPELQRRALASALREFGLGAGTPAADTALAGVRAELEARLPRQLWATARDRAAAPERLLRALAEQVLGEALPDERLPVFVGKLGALAASNTDLLARLLRFRDELRTRLAVPGRAEPPSSWLPARDDGQALLRSWLTSDAPVAALQQQLQGLGDELVAIVEALRDSAVAIRSLAAAAMAPDKLLLEAGGGAINALATKAPVWKKHQEAWAEVAQGAKFLAAIEQEIQRLVAARQARG
jgi:hypothetical protein